MSTAFQRARGPEQIEQRRTALIGAARSLLEGGGVAAVTLSAIAREAELAKSNVYRYFESREEILLELLVADETTWVAELERALAPLAGRGEPRTVAVAIATTLSARPTLCQLVAIVANVLEHNLSVDAIVQFKTRVLELSIRITNALHTALPGLDHEQAPAVLRYVQALIAGLYPMAHPSAPAQEAMERPEFETMCSDFEPDLAGAVELMLRGITR